MEASLFMNDYRAKNARQPVAESNLSRRRSAYFSQSAGQKHRMKARFNRCLTLLVSAVMLLSAMGYASAADRNLIKNSGFENGTENWLENGTVELTVSEDAYAGQKALKLDGRTNGSDSVRQDITEVLSSGGTGYYDFGVMAKSTGGDIPRACAVIELTDASGNPKWINTENIPLTSGTFTEVARRFVNITWEGALSSAFLYLHTPGSSTGLILDNFSLQKSFLSSDGANADAIYKPLEPVPVAQELQIPAGTQKIVFTAGSNRFRVDGEEKAIDPDNPEVSAAIVDGRTMLPVRALSEALGGTVTWDEATSTAEIVLGDKHISMTQDKTAVIAGDKTLECEVPLMNREGRLMAPLRFLVQDVMQNALIWDAASGTATVLKGVHSAEVTAAEDNLYRQWRPVEYTFETEKVYTLEEKPWLSVKFEAAFTGPDGTVLTIPGFWDGDNIFKVRFTATMPGTWTMTTKCFDDISLNGLSYSIQFSEPAEDETNRIYRHGGFLKASDNGRYLTYTDGTPFYYTTETMWYTPSDQFLPIDAPASIYSIEAMGEEYFAEKGITSAFNHILDLRQEQGFSGVRTGFLGNINGNSMQALYHSKRELDIKAWQMTDEYFKSIMDHDMVQITFPAWVDAAGGWASYFEYEEILDYMNARYGAWAVTYGMGPEYNDSSKQASGLAKCSLDALAYAHSIDPYDRAHTIQPIVWNMTGDADKMEWDKEYLEFIMLEGGHETPYGISEDYYKQAWNYRRGGKPVPTVVVETTWDGIIRNNYPPHDDYVVRYNQYRGWLLGAKGADYGVQGLWYPVLHYDDTMFEDAWGATNEPWWDAIYKPSAQQLGYMRNFFESMEWWKLEPVFDAIPASEKILPPPAGEGTPPENSYKKALVATIDSGKQYVVYIPKMTDASAALTMTVSGGTGTYQAKWFNPREGTFSEGSTAAFDGGKLTIPNRPDTEDWLLVLERAE